MKSIVDKLHQAGVLCKKLTPVLPKELGSRKRIDLYKGVDTSGYYCSVMALSKKSRVLRKEVDVLMLLHEKMEKHADVSIRRRYIWIDAPLCSKAKAMLEDFGWVLV